MRSSVGRFCRREHQRRRLILQRQNDLVRLGHFVGVAGPDHQQIGNRPQRGQMLDRLVRRAVLAHADRIVREDVEHGQAHEGGQADRRPHVVGEDEERGPVGPQAAKGSCRCRWRPWRVRGCRSGSCGRRTAGLESRRRPSNFKSVLVEGARSAEPPSSHGTCLATWLSTLPDEARLAMPLASAGKGLNVGVPALGQLAAVDQVELPRPGRDIAAWYAANFALPVARAASRRAAPMPSRKWRRHFGGHKELLVLRPAVDGLRQADFLLAQRRAVGLVACSALFGEPKAITLRTMISVGRSRRLLEVSDRAAQGRPGR